jgi:adenylate cyclase
LSALAEATDIPSSGSEAAGRAEVRQDTQKFAEAAIAESKRKGLLLAVRARWVALVVTAVTIPIINPHWDVVYYVLMIIPFAVIGWAQLKVGKAGRSGPELFLMFCDLALLTFLAIVPNPLTGSWPLVMQFRFNTFSYFFIFLATATLGLFMANGGRDGLLDRGPLGHRGCLDLPAARNHAALSERVRTAVGSDHRMFDVLNPAAVGIWARFRNHRVPDRRHDPGAGGATLQRAASATPGSNANGPTWPVFFAQRRRAIVETMSRSSRSNPECRVLFADTSVSPPMPTAAVRSRS